MPRLDDGEQIWYEAPVLAPAHERLDLVAVQRETALPPEVLVVKILIHARVQLVAQVGHQRLCRPAIILLGGVACSNAASPHHV